jgi:diguanylate cyclase (GGDEF)-like protein/PAS domain S-box-containing protein
MQADAYPTTSPLIMIIAVDPNLQLLVRESLDKAGYRSIAASGGLSAINAFKEACPDMLLLDMDLGQAGLETCRNVRSLPGGEYLPILLIADLDGAGTIPEVCCAGTTDFIAKPLRPEILLYRVGHLLGACQSIRQLAASEAQLARAQQTACLGSWQWDEASGYFNGSVEALRILGLADKGTVTFDDFIDAISAPDKSEVAARLRESFATATAYVGECPIVGAGGEQRIIRLQGKTEKSADRTRPLMVGTIQDVTDMKQADDHLRLLKVAIDSLHIGITMSDVQGRIIYANPAEARMHGRTTAELIGRRAAEFAPPALRNPRLPELIDHNDVWRRESVNVRSNGEEFPVQLASIAVRNDAGRCLGMVTSCEDITHWKEAQERINQLAYFDSLTGLPNRRTFFDMLNKAMALAHREERLVGLIFLDLDNFKDINDTLGHDFGDRFLREVSGKLGEIMRESDTLARFGGDEFIVLLTSLYNQESAAIVARRIQSILSHPFTLDGKQVFSSSSIGIALFPDDGHDSESLFRCADTAMYQAKETGKGTFRFFSSEMNQKIMRRVALESGLRRAIGSSEFFMSYQPQWDLRAGKITGVEALVRWQSPEFGLLMPGEFISLAECTGLIVPLGEWILQTACLQSRKWQEQGYDHLRVAVNISGRQLIQADFIDHARKVIAETGVNPAAIEFEFTESVLMDNAEKAAEALRELKGLGIQLSLDDFGTGYSSLSYLKHFPFDRVKIDRSFVTDVIIDKDDAAIVMAIISMSHSLNLKVIAEGVETLEQMIFLQNHNCDEIQGYYLARPMSAAELDLKLAEAAEGRRLP